MYDQPTISVVVPCYNREETIDRCLQSIWSQTIEPLEVIVVDDGSTDNSAAVAEKHHTLVRVIRQANAGAAAARNRGIAECRGDWIAFVDSDDVWSRDKLQKQLACLRYFANAQLIFCDTRTIDDHGVAMPSRFALGGVREQVGERMDSHSLMNPELFSTLLTDSRVITSAVMVKRGLPELEFAEDIWGSEDWYLWLRLSKSYQFAMVDEVLVDMYQQGDNISGRKGKLYRNDVEVLKRLAAEEPTGSQLQKQLLRLVRERSTGAIYFSILAGDYHEARLLLNEGQHEISSSKQLFYRLSLSMYPRLLRRLMEKRQPSQRW